MMTAVTSPMNEQAIQALSDLMQRQSSVSGYNIAADQFDRRFKEIFNKASSNEERSELMQLFANEVNNAVNNSDRINDPDLRSAAKSAAKKLANTLQNARKFI